MLQAPIALPTSPHVIVVGNEKGGSGKTTVAMHIAIALMKAGQRVATIDLDSRQRSLTHYAENRVPGPSGPIPISNWRSISALLAAKAPRFTKTRLPSSPISIK